MGNTRNAFGKPVYDDFYSFPQDSQDAVDFADEFANIRAGTSAERQALPAAKQRPGMLWSETDTGELLRTDGASRWTRIGDSGWIPLTPTTPGWTAVSGHAPRGRLLNGVVYLEGALQRNTGGALTNLATIPTALRHLGAKTVFIGTSTALRSGNIAASELYANETGVLSVGGYTAIDGNPGWVIPISSSYVHDQR